MMLRSQRSQDACDPVLGHVVVLLENRLDANVVNSDAVPPAEDVAAGSRTLVVDCI